ncbi:MAG TPA: hypothetical protein VD997_04330 [Phycisphaerales bacterium]|nr:hypothetical protein [Phycisphaerales bacterium]
MSGFQGIRAVYATLGPVGALATIAGCAAAVVVGASLVTFTRGALTTAPDVDPNAQVAAKGDDKTEKYLAQINGRTLFYQPVRVVKEEPKVIEEDKGPPPPPPPTTEYGGSRIIAMVLDTVWFEDGRKMKVGDEEKDDTVVVSVNSPWDAKLRWKKVEFTVPLFGRDTVVIKKERGSETAAATPEPPKPPEAAPAEKAPETKTAGTPGDKPAEPTPEKPADPPKPGGEKIAANEAAPASADKATEAKKDEPAKDAQPSDGQPK